MNVHKTRGDLDALAIYPHPIEIQAPNWELAQVDADYGMAKLEEMAEQEMANDEKVW
jgi:hypothetical protein